MNHRGFLWQLFAIVGMAGIAKGGLEEEWWNKTSSTENSTGKEQQQEEAPIYRDDGGKPPEGEGDGKSPPTLTPTSVGTELLSVDDEIDDLSLPMVEIEEPNQSGLVATGCEIEVTEKFRSRSYNIEGSFNDRTCARALYNYGALEALASVNGPEAAARAVQGIGVRTFNPWDFLPPIIKRTSDEEYVGVVELLGGPYYVRLYAEDGSLLDHQDMHVTSARETVQHCTYWVNLWGKTIKSCAPPLLGRCAGRTPVAAIKIFNPKDICLSLTVQNSLESQYRQIPMCLPWFLGTAPTDFALLKGGFFCQDRIQQIICDQKSSAHLWTYDGDCGAYRSSSWSSYTADLPVSFPSEYLPVPASLPGIPLNSDVTLSRKGKYCADSNGVIECNRDEVGEWEVWKVGGFTIAIGFFGTQTIMAAEEYNIQLV
mmetsp:Transcript_11522/g.21268  ORF Transcript_11522/g.21268 Transcript_11522/m.21268 type:complete len:427 (+) Transcript_11522:83-1363(+)